MMTRYLFGREAGCLCDTAGQRESLTRSSGIWALVKKNTPYFGGESVSYIDYMVWPWFEKFGLFGLKTLVDETPNIKAWQDRMLQDPAVTATYTEPEVFLAFSKLYFQDSLEAVDYGLD